MLITNRVLVFTRMDAMISRASRYGRRHGPCRVQQSTFERFLHTCPPDLLRRQGGRLISLPGYPESAPEIGPSRRPTKLLLNVSIERSLGPVQVVMSPENSVGDLVKRAMEIYVREKRRPLLVGNDPHRFQLHYSQFSLESKFSSSSPPYVALSKIIIKLISNPHNSLFTILIKLLVQIFFRNNFYTACLMCVLIIYVFNHNFKFVNLHY